MLIDFPGVQRKGKRNKEIEEGKVTTDSRGCMQLSMDDRIRRRSSLTTSTTLKTSVPNPLVLKDFAAVEHNVLQTPPPTAARSVASSTNYNAKSILAAASAVLSLPLTPCTPDLIDGRFPMSLRRKVERPRQQDDLVSVQELDLVTDSAAKQSQPSLSQQNETTRTTPTTSRSLPFTSPSKRSHSDVAGSTELLAEHSSPTKKRITQNDLIANPLCELRRLGVPVAYVREKLTGIAGRLLGKTQGAACFIRAVPRRRYKSNETAIRARIIPRRDPGAAFSLYFNTTPSASINPATPTASPPTAAAATAATPSSPSSVTTPRAATSAFTPSFSVRSQVPERRASTATALGASDSKATPIYPLHVEVALLRAPILGRLLLSGRVYIGDTVELEMPHPGAFEDVMRWMYTGGDKSCPATDGARECIDALWGRFWRVD